MTNVAALHTEKFSHVLENIAQEFHPLIEEHKDAWELMNKVREGYSLELYQQALEHVNETINHHFIEEEELLLPVLEKYLKNNTTGPSKIREEHVSIINKYNEANQLFEKHLDNLEQDPTEAEVPEALIKQMNTLAYLLKKHIEKEDNFLFPLLSLIFSTKERKWIAEQLDNQ